MAPGLAVKLVPFPAGIGTVCRSQLERFRTSETLHLRMCRVRLSSLGASRPVDPIELDGTAAGVLTTPGIPQGQLPYYSLARGMPLCRGGRREGALATLPASGFLDPQDEMLAIVFMPARPPALRGGQGSEQPRSRIESEKASGRLDA